MKFYLSAIIAAVAFFTTNEIYAQMPMSSMMGYPYGRPGYSNSMSGRMDRSIGMSQYSNGKKKPDPNAKTDLLSQSVDHLETKLTLDSFQKAVIKDLMEKNQKEEDLVLKEEIPDESKYEKVTILRNKLDSDINKLLSPDQQEKFRIMNEKLKKENK